jgi:hypothetical protein
MTQIPGFIQDFATFKTLTNAMRTSYVYPLRGDAGSFCIRLRRIWLPSFLLLPLLLLLLQACCPLRRLLVFWFLRLGIRGCLKRCTIVAVAIIAVLAILAVLAIMAVFAILAVLAIIAVLAVLAIIAVIAVIAIVASVPL